MNGAVYISFFQGQLESVLEQVVQLAVQEISKTVGSSLNTLLLETAVKEQENRRLRLQLQSRENRGRANANNADVGGGGGGGGGSPKNKAGKTAGEERADSGRTKPEQKLHAPGAHSTEPGLSTDTRRLEQRGRVVDQLKSVMEQVLDFAVRELTKIVEASFDDLLLEITKMEREQRVLEERLDRSSDRGGEKGRGGGAGGRRRGSENDSASPSGSEDAREELAEVPASKETAERGDPERPPVLSVSQDWVPILDKVFGQKWCSDVWQIKELGEGVGGRSLSEGGAQQVQPLPAPSLTLEPSPSSPQLDPRWTPLEDMEVFSPDDEESQRNSGRGAAAAAAATSTTGPSPGPSPGPPVSPAGSSGRRSSASMLHRLLTLPSQLLDEEDAAAAANEKLAALATDGVEPPSQTCASPLTTREEEGEEEEEEEEGEDKGRKKKRRRVWSECEECGRRFSRMSLLKAHRQTHVTENAAADTSSAFSPPGGSPSDSAPRCSECGRKFSSAARLSSHIRTQHPGNRS